MSQRNCTFYIAAEETQMSQQEIQKALESTKIDDKIKALKSLVIQIIHDEQFPRMIMSVINTLVPLQSESHQLKKILLFYWEVIEKVNSNGKLKDEMILVCNSLRNDLLHPNEYIRGRTLKLISRIQYKGILEPLQTALIENVSHKHVYVRRNAVVCLYEIFLNSGDDLVSDVDEMMEKMLLTETDLSTKRNAFLLLFHANQNKALEYLNNALTQDDQDIGDIMQLAILELFRKVCKLNPAQKPKLLKSIFHFTKSKSPSVLYETANTLATISPTPTSLKLAVGIYMQLLTTQTDNNVKLVVLERIEHLNPKVLEDKVIDLAGLLSQQSIDIRRKVLTLLQKLIKDEAVVQISEALVKELKKIQNETDQASQEFRVSLLETLLQFTQQFNQVHQLVGQCLVECIIINSAVDDLSAQLATQICEVIMPQEKLKKAFIQQFYEIQHIRIFKCGLWVLGEYCGQDECTHAFNEIKKAIGSLPLENIVVVAEEQQPEQKKSRIRTVILPDGTYGQIEESAKTSKERFSKLREFLMNNSYMASQLARTLMKLLRNIEDNLFNKYASQTLMIFCAIVRYYQQNINKVDQESIEKIYYAIRVLTSCNRESLDNYIKFNEGEVFYKQDQVIKSQNQLKSSSKTKSQKNKMILLKSNQMIQLYLDSYGKNKTNLISEIDLADEESIESQQIQRKVDDSFVGKLNHIVQLTGYSDPIYAEAFVLIHKYDIQFDVLFINRSQKMVQNVQVEFKTQGESKVIEKPSGVTLQPNQSSRVKTAIKFSSADIGLIIGSIHFENNAGVEQPYLITKEIVIDLIDFIYPGSVSIDEFRKLWAKYEWENRICINTHFKEIWQFIRFMEKTLNMKLLTDTAESDYVCANLYGKTKFDDDFLMNISADYSEGRISGFIRIRSKVKGIVVNLGEKVKQLQQKIDT